MSFINCTGEIEEDVVSYEMEFPFHKLRQRKMYKLLANENMTSEKNIIQGDLSSHHYLQFSSIINGE
ncbi:hypothetical protein HI914_03239 [Erysiphe necator]|nr:hypothetical protein HI914_03239 [Erysiphe necator]